MARRRSRLIFLFGLGKARNCGKNLCRNYSQGDRVYSIDGVAPTLPRKNGNRAGGSVLILETRDEERKAR